MDYTPNSFKDIMDSEIGPRLWSFLNSREIKMLMILSTQLGHPAAEGVGDKLIDEFSDEVKKDRIKQSIGHMIRQIMEGEGFVLKRRGVKCRKKTELFSYASTYMK